MVAEALLAGAAIGALAVAATEPDAPEANNGHGDGDGSLMTPLMGGGNGGQGATGATGAAGAAGATGAQGPAGGQFSPQYNTSVGPSSNPRSPGTLFFSLAGIQPVTGAPTEAFMEHYFPVAKSLTVCTVHITTNTLSGTVVYTVRKNGANTAMAVTVGAGGTGVFALTGGPVSFAAGDRACLQAVAGGAGSFNPTQTYSEFT